jgi:hypothetical protein
MRAVVVAAAFLVMGCGGSEYTAPLPTPWFVGEWRAVSVNGMPLPARADTGRFAYRYDSLRVYLGAGWIHSFNYYGGRENEPSRLGCSGMVHIARSGDTITITGPNTLNNCTFFDIFERRFVRRADSLIHVWRGHRFVLTRRD